MPNLTNNICDIATQVSKNPCVIYLNDVQLSDGLLFQNFGHYFETGGMVETIVERGVENVELYGPSISEYTKSLQIKKCLQILIH